ncbi:ABC transporter ATP-binding protein [Enterovirga sp.]|uniref:ABC transporter ATP-binding protein n=1 Tax=Enterovirga sp. TaxID=2026350 RepID=UPI002601A4CF|nr:ABC transporter ATP-binding protein [Enterovirga sp.]MDB5589930.1 glycine/betaine transporter [Enterovirga sp.]
MIRLEGVGKHYPGAARPAVDGIDLLIEEGRTCALIGPSGCGKTTTLRMVNRLIEPSSGRIVVAGRDVTAADPVKLRRGIGYVIQGTGLFPHLSVAGNVATVPRLLGWDRARIAARVDAMLGLVGLDPALFRDRRPASLSGGQRQRVGVARALAADPPVLLMDEPFAAVDPLERGRLQREITEILRRLRKTVILVTHDLDEAIRMGDTVAVMRDGRLVQHDRPDQVLAAPADAFVAEFLGSDRALRRLTLLTAAAACRSGERPPEGAPEVPAEASLQVALSILLGSGAEALAVVDGGPRPVGTLSLAAIRALAAGLPDPSGAVARSPPLV